MQTATTPSKKRQNMQYVVSGRLSCIELAIDRETWLGPALDKISTDPIDRVVRYSAADKIIQQVSLHLLHLLQVIIAYTLQS